MKAKKYSTRYGSVHESGQLGEQSQASTFDSSETYHRGGEARESMHAPQSSNPDGLQHKPGQGRQRRKALKGVLGSTHHGITGAEVQEFCNQSVNMKTHDLGCFQ